MEKGLGSGSSSKKLGIAAVQLEFHGLKKAETFNVCILYFRWQNVASASKS